MVFENGKIPHLSFEWCSKRVKIPRLSFVRCSKRVKIPHLSFVWCSRRVKYLIYHLYGVRKGSNTSFIICMVFEKSQIPHLSFGWCSKRVKIPYLVSHSCSFYGVRKVSLIIVKIHVTVICTVFKRTQHYMYILFL